MPLRLRTLGGLSLEAGDGVPLGGRATQRRRLALLSLLAAAGDAGLTRDKLLAYLWPERDTEHARHALSQALYAIRHDLGHEAVLTGVDALRLNENVVWSDVAELRQAIAAGEPARVVELYAGPFLDGFFLSDAPALERWVDAERERLERAYGSALGALAADALARGNAVDAVQWLRRLAALEPFNSEIALQLMRALAVASGPADALRHYRAHVALLREEIGVEPDDSARAFAQQLGTARSPPPSSGEAMSASPLPMSSGEVARTRDRDGDSERPELPDRPGYRRVGHMALAVGFLATCAALLFREPETGLHEARSVVLAAVSGPDTSLALAVREALRAELEQEPGISVLSDAAVARTLRLMLAAPEAGLSPVLASEVAQRHDIAYVITASVHPLGEGAQIIARLLDARTDAALATRRERPANEAEILGAVGRIGASMRSRLSGAPSARPSPLPAVSTTSVPALRSYALARLAFARADWARTVELAEAALVHDSLFALAHYLAGDVLWYVDQQGHSDEHMRLAFKLAARLPPRERLIVNARYEQLVRDRPDSALVYWKLLADSYPDEPLAYEGMRWAYRALGQTELMAKASEQGFRQDSTLRLPYLQDRISGLINAGDSAAAFAAAVSLVDIAPQALQVARYHWALRHGVPSLELASDLSEPERQVVLLLNGRYDDAADLIEQIRGSGMQYYPRALLAQARAEMEARPTSLRARALLREVVEWIVNADLSPPAYARLAERAAEAAVRVHDRESLVKLRRLITVKDNGRLLRSYVHALTTLDACEAFLEDDPGRAAELVAQSRHEMFYARSVATLMLLEADARAAAADTTRARALYRELVQSDSNLDIDREVQALVRQIAARRLRDMTGG